MTKVSNNQPGAQHPPKAADPLAAASKEEKVKGAFAHLDANHDGKLAKDELGADGEALLAGAGGKPVDWKAFKEAELAPPSFAQLDQDHDGKLNGKEARGLDRNHDGTVDQQAFLQARKADAWQVQQAYRQGELAKLDADHDGQVSAAEAGKLASADKDGDGVVSQQEYNQARNEAWQAQVDQQRQARFQQLDL
jgi:Ca2+-binding EF-hand superfamily protein